MSTQIKLANLLAYISLSFCGLVVLSIIILMVWPITVLDMKSPARIMNPNHIVTVGSPVLFERVYTKYYDIPADVTVAFVDDFTYSLPLLRSNYPAGMEHDISSTISVPTTLPLGTYYLSITYDYMLFGIRHISYHIVTENFTVVGPDCK